MKPKTQTLTSPQELSSKPISPLRQPEYSPLKTQSQYPQINTIAEKSQSYQPISPKTKSEYSFTQLQPKFRDLLEADTAKPDYLHIFDTYIMYQNTQGVMVIDQHAVHEKVLLEQLMNQDNTITSQALLFPFTYTVPISDKSIMMEVLAQLPGFEVDEFGKSEIIIRALPSFFASHPKVEQHIQSLLSLIEQRGNTTDIEELRVELMKTIACKSAIKAGYSLSQAEIEALIQDAAKTDFGFACCHGRPTMVQLDKNWFEKQFSR
jgi:DNA mismatch repair protein MutL